MRPVYITSGARGPGGAWARSVPWDTWTDTMIRRIPVLLALVLAGPWGGVGEAPSFTTTAAVAFTVAAADTHALETFARSGAPALAAAVQEGSGTGPRTSSQRPDLTERDPYLRNDLAAFDAACDAARTAYLVYAAPFAFARAGLLSYRTTAPPPFRSL